VWTGVWKNCTAFGTEVFFCTAVGRDGARGGAFVAALLLVAVVASADSIQPYPVLPFSPPCPPLPHHRPPNCFAVDRSDGPQPAGGGGGAGCRGAHPRRLPAQVVHRRRLEERDDTAADRCPRAGGVQVCWALRKQHEPNRHLIGIIFVLQHTCIFNQRRNSFVGFCRGDGGTGGSLFGDEVLAVHTLIRAALSCRTLFVSGACPSTRP